MIIRHIMPVLDRYMNSFPAVLVTGARQVGKTTLMRGSSFAGSYISFDDPEHRMAVQNDPKFFISVHTSPLLLDEVQYVPPLFPYLELTIDSARRNGMYLMSGSQQFSMMQNVTESLAGRVGILSLGGISQREESGDSFSRPFLPDKKYFLERKPSLPREEMTSVWKRIHRGWFPSLVTGSVSAEDFFPSYTQTYLERDVRALSQVGDLLKFYNFISVVAARTGQLVNYADLASTVGVDSKTAKKWLSILAASSIVYLLPPYSGNVEKRLIKTPKLYFADTGLAAYLTRWLNPEVLAAGASAGAFFETFVVMEIVKSFSNAGMAAPLYFYRDKDGKEIDLIIDMNGCIYPVGIKLTATPRERDCVNFKAASAIKGRKIMGGTLICSCSDVFALSEDVVAAPFRYI